ncbi:MAG: T9SS type A sorting domain-containing protein [Bacteroidia bacterium]
MAKNILPAIIAVCSFFSASAQIVNIPDANFKAYLTGNRQINLNGDTEIQTSEAMAYAGDFSCIALRITNITGIEAFPNLRNVNFLGNEITSVDLSQNTSLVAAIFHRNQINSINVNGAGNLAQLGLNSNNITTIDISHNPNLRSVSCNYNPISQIDVTQNPELDYLSCSFTSVSTIDLSQNPNLEYLYCEGLQLTSLDVSDNPELLTLYAPNNNLAVLNVNNNTALRQLIISSNHISILDISNNLALREFSCQNNQISTLNVHNHSELEYVGLDNNLFTTLDFSDNHRLISFNCSESPMLAHLNLKNGNNSNITQYNMRLVSNPNLYCIEVDDPAFSTSTWTERDAQVNFSENCTNSIEQSTLQNMVIYPNPVNHTLFLELPNDITPDHITITDISGKKIYSQSQYNNKIETTGLATGMYMLTATANGKIFNTKFIKQ